MIIELPALIGRQALIPRGSLSGVGSKPRRRFRWTASAPTPDDPGRITRCVCARSTPSSSRSRRGAVRVRRDRSGGVAFGCGRAGRSEVEREAADVDELGQGDRADSATAGSFGLDGGAARSGRGAAQGENRELARANAILQDAASFFGAVLDRQSSRRPERRWHASRKVSLGRPC
jgi:hypothetical protein